MSRVGDDEYLLKLEKKIEKVHTDRTTKNGNPYCALELETGDWVFVWEGHWKDEIEDHKSEYRGLQADLFVVDKSDDDDDDPWYHLKAVVPSDPDEAGKMLTRRTKEKSEDDVDESRELPQDAKKAQGDGQQLFGTGT